MKRNLKSQPYRPTISNPTQTIPSSESSPPREKPRF